MAIHELKCWPESLDPLFKGLKSFDVRKNDRNFKPGDLVVFKEWEPKIKSYSGRWVRKRINYMITGTIAPSHGLATGYCVLQLMDTATEGEPT